MKKNLLVFVFGLFFSSFALNAQIYQIDEEQIFNQDAVPYHTVNIRGVFYNLQIVEPAGINSSPYISLIQLDNNLDYNFSMSNPKGWSFLLPIALDNSREIEIVDVISSTSNRIDVVYNARFKGASIPYGIGIVQIDLTSITNYQVDLRFTKIVSSSNNIKGNIIAFNDGTLYIASSIEVSSTNCESVIIPVSRADLSMGSVIDLDFGVPNLLNEICYDIEFAGTDLYTSSIVSNDNDAYECIVSKIDIGALTYDLRFDPFGITNLAPVGINLNTTIADYGVSNKLKSPIVLSNIPSKNNYELSVFFNTSNLSTIEELKISDHFFSSVLSVTFHRITHSNDWLNSVSFIDLPNDGSFILVSNSLSNTNKSSYLLRRNIGTGGFFPLNFLGYKHNSKFITDYTQSRVTGNKYIATLNGGVESLSVTQAEFNGPSTWFYLPSCETYLTPSLSSSVHNCPSGNFYKTNNTVSSLLNTFQISGTHGLNTLPYTVPLSGVTTNCINN